MSPPRPGTQDSDWRDVHLLHERGCSVTASGGRRRGKGSTCAPTTSTCANTAAMGSGEAEVRAAEMASRTCSLSRLYGSHSALCHTVGSAIHSHRSAY